MSISVTKNVKRGRRLTGGFTGLIVAGCALLAGCGSGPTADTLPVLKVYDVTGKVLLPDGKPLTGGWIYFVPKAGDLPITPSGVIGPDGTFSLATGGSGEGVPVGEYKLRIETVEAPTDRKNRKPIVPRRYTDEDSSGLVATVRAETNRLDPIRLSLK